MAQLGANLTFMYSLKSWLLSNLDLKTLERKYTQLKQQRKQNIENIQNTVMVLEISSLRP